MCRHDQLGRRAVRQRAAVAVAQHEHQIVGPGATDDPRRVQPETRAYGAAQRGSVTVRIAVVLRGKRRHRLCHARRRAERALVGGQFDDAVDALQLRLDLVAYGSG